MSTKIISHATMCTKYIIATLKVTKLLLDIFKLIKELL